MVQINIDKLRSELNAHPQGISDAVGRHLADKAIRYCKQVGRDTPYAVDAEDDDTVFSINHFGTESLAAWQNPEARAYFTDGLKVKPKAEEKPKSVWETPGTLAFQVAAASLLAGKFIISAKDDGLYQLYAIEDWQRQTAVPVVGSPQDIGISVSRAVVSELERAGVAITKGRISVMLTAFHAKAAAMPAPKLLGQPDEDGWCLHRATVRPDASVPFPYIGQFLSRLNDAAAYAAWWWGVYSGRNRGRQALYIYDHEGQGGKSKINDAMATALFGDRIYCAFPSGANTNDAHTSSHFLGKRLVSVGDNKNSYLLQSGFFKQLLGDDPSFVNPKYLQPFSTHFEARAVVLGNVAPFILRARHSTSRILYLTLSKLDLPDERIDVTYPEKCVAELPGFLAYAEACYAERCPNDYAIQANESVHQVTAGRIAECETMYADAFDLHFTADPEGMLTHKDWAKVMRDLHYDPLKSEDMLQWVKAVTGAEQQAIGERRVGWCLEGVRLSRASDRRRNGADRDAMMHGVE